MTDEHVRKDAFDQAIAAINQRIGDQEKLFQANLATTRAEIRSDVQGLLQPISNSIAVLVDRANKQFAWNVAIFGGIVAGIVVTLAAGFLKG